LPKVLHKNNHWWILCPGCKTNHRFDVRWTFNYDDEKPTFEPRLKSLTMRPEGSVYCFARVRGGFIEFDPTSQHALAGHIVELLDWDNANWDDKTNTIKVNTEGGDSDGQRHEGLQGEQGR
jgi:hypothetical protein